MTGRRTIVVLIICVVAFFRCENTTEIVYPPTTIEVLILDDESDPLPGAQVRLFDNEETFSRARIFGDYSGELESSTSGEDGAVIFEDVDPRLSYYFFVNYRDRSRLVDLENFDQSFKFPGFVPKGSRTRIEIKLEQADNAISFFALPENESFLPIDVFLDGDSIGRLTEVVPLAPQGPNMSGTISFRMRSGVTKWYARSPSGCLWTGEFALAATQSFVSQELQRCESGSVSFWTSDANSGALPITIKLGAIDQFGTLKVASPVEPVNCFPGHTLSGNREAGDYEYIATSADRRCTWTGTFSISDGECRIIELDVCL